MTPISEKLCVLIVCSDDFLRKRLGASAAATGLFAPVMAAEDGYMAMAHIWDAIATGQPPDLVLVDLNLPHFNGVQLTRELRRHPETRSLFVAVIDDVGMEMDQTAAELAGADLVTDYSSSGVDFIEMMKMIGRRVIFGDKAPVL